MISKEAMRDKIRRFRSRRTRENVRYIANGFGTDHIIWRSLCALHTQSRVEKENMRYLTTRDMMWLLAMKQYVVESGKDSFHMREIKRFINFHFKQEKSARTSVIVGNNLMRAGYLIREGLDQRSKYVLTMKARAFYHDLYDLFSI